MQNKIKVGPVPKWICGFPTLPNMHKYMFRMDPRTVRPVPKRPVEKQTLARFRFERPVRWLVLGSSVRKSGGTNL
jgi:hypothetical protein